MKRIITEDEPFINEKLNNQVDRVVDDVLMKDSSWKIWERDFDKQEQMHLSELGRICQNFSQTDFAVVCIYAVKNYPLMYMQIAAEEIINKEGEK